MKPRILIIDNSPEATGAFQSIVTYASALKDSFDFYFAVPRDGKTSVDLEENNFQCIQLKFLEIRRSLSSLVFYLPVLFLNTIRLRKFITRHQISVVHVNDMYNMTGIMLKMLKPSLRLIYHVRLLRSSYARMLYNAWLRRIRSRSDMILVVSEIIRRDVEAMPGPAPVRLLYDFLPFNGTLERRRNSDTIHFAFPANYVSGKGHDFAINAFSRVFERHRNITLTFSGGDLKRKKNKALKQALTEKIVSKGLEAVVSVNGPYSEIDSVLAGADVVLMFSESESFSFVCYETMVRGVPVIATRCGGPEEFIHDGVSGLLVNNRDEDSMAAAMERLVNDSLLRASIGEQAAVAMRQKMAEVDSIGNMRDVYQQLIKGYFNGKMPI